ncbi:MAG: GDSL-type esterase/lipase family protein [Pseudomonadota bacterium]
MPENPNPTRFWVGLLALVAVSFALLGWVFTYLKTAPVTPAGADRRAQYHTLAGQVGGLYDTVPDHRVGRILQRSVTKPEAGTEIRSNNAGMRSDFDYGPKSDDRYRVIFLGDSFAYGFGGAVEDRYSNLIADRLTAHQIQGRLVEVLNLSIGSWTAVNQAQYLSTRLSAYEPDLIVVLLVSNDISDTQGVRGIGAISNEFSPEQRPRGSGVFHNAWPLAFGVNSVNLLAYDLAEESRIRWRDAAAALTRLESLQQQLGGRLLLTILDENPYFNALTHHYLDQSGFQSPIAMVDYGLTDPAHRLPHDPHPSRTGHQQLAEQLLGHLAALGWIDDSFGGAEPPPRWNGPTPDQDALAQLRKEVARSYLHPGINFESMSAQDPIMFLGGVLPDLEVTDPLSSPPYASPYTALVLSREPGAKSVRLTVELPTIPELFPLTLRLYLDGKLGKENTYEASKTVRRVSLVAESPPSGRESIEVKLTSSQHFAGIEDHRTRSVRLIRVVQE